MSTQKRKERYNAPNKRKYGIAQTPETMITQQQEGKEE
jgi:hypothetical protein